MPPMASAAYYCAQCLSVRAAATLGTMRLARDTAVAVALATVALLGAGIVLRLG